MPPGADQDCTFVVSRVKQMGQCSFTPPWRTNPLKVRDFLRGQRVPLHVRDAAPVIYLNNNSNVVAVFVEEREGGNEVYAGKVGTWIVHAKFNGNKEKAGQLLCLHLELPC